MDYEKKKIKDSDSEHESLVCFYDTNSVYAITIQPDNDHQRLSKKYSVYSRISNYYSDVFNCFDKENEDTFPYYFVMEVSEPKGSLQKGIGARLHHHGIVMFNNSDDILTYSLKTLREMNEMGRVHIKKIYDRDSFTNWWKYIHKQHVIPNARRILSNYTDGKLFVKDCFGKLVKDPDN